MNFDWPTIGAFLFAAAIAGWSMIKDSKRPSIATREQLLEQKVRELENTVKTLLTDRTAAQIQIETLRRELDDARLRITHLEAELASVRSPATPAPASANATLLVAIGIDPMLQIDLAALRKVSQRTGIRLTRLSPVSKANLERTIDRHRKTGDPLRWMHYAGHAGPEGLEFADGLATGQWLSEHLRGIEVLLINGCAADAVADWIGVVPAVISMREDIDNQDAAAFCEVFWLAMAEGLSVESAFNRALDRCPPAVAEFTELHI